MSMPMTMPMFMAMSKYVCLAGFADLAGLFGSNGLVNSARFIGLVGSKLLMGIIFISFWRERNKNYQQKHKQSRKERYIFMGNKDLRRGHTEGHTPVTCSSCCSTETSSSISATSISSTSSTTSSPTSYGVFLFIFPQGVLGVISSN